MIVENHKSRCRNARRFVYNVSFGVGLVAAIGLASTLSESLITDVHAEGAVVSSDIVQTEVSSENDTDPRLRVVKTPKETINTETQGVTTLDYVSSDMGKTLVNNVSDKESSVIENPEAEITELDKILETAESDSEYIWMFLTASDEIGGAGFTNAGAAAIMGCMQAESGLTTSALNGTDGGFGLLQWTDTYSTSRKTNLINWCNENQLDAYSLLGQLKFAVYELKNTYSSESGYRYSVYETLRDSESIEECLKMFFCHAEAGTDVPISDTYVYAGHSTTQVMYDNRLAYSWGFYTTHTK